MRRAWLCRVALWMALISWACVASAQPKPVAADPDAGSGGTSQPASTPSSGPTGSATASVGDADRPKIKTIETTNNKVGPQTPEEIAKRGEALKVFLITIGPGVHPFFKFGHNAIWIHDELESPKKMDLAYNFGGFDASEPGLIAKFFLGRMTYRVWCRQLYKELKLYRKEKRWMTAYRLNMAPAMRWQMSEYLKWRARKENRDYLYHYYRNNCSTRVRDVLDKYLDGRLRQAATGPAEFTYRQQVQRLTASYLPEYLMLDLVVSHMGDQPITVWEESFIPMVLQKLVKRTTVFTPTGERPLVTETLELAQPLLPRAPAKPPSWWSYFLLFGVLVGAALAAASRWCRRRRVVRAVAVLLVSLLGLALGALGWLQVWLWAVTDHDAMWANENILQCPPWLLVLPFFVVGVWRGRSQSLRRWRWLTLTAAGAALLGLVLKALPWFYQDNWQIIAATLPLLLGMALAVFWLQPCVSPQTPRPASPE